MVLGFRAFPHRVAAGQQAAAIWEFELKAGGAIGAILDRASHDLGAQGAGFDVVALSGADEVGVFDVEKVELPDVDAVGAGVKAGSITVEQAVANDNRATGSAGHQAVFVGDEAYALDKEGPPFGSNPSAIAVGHPRAGQREITDRDTLSHRDEQGFALTRLVGDDDLVGIAYPLDRQVVRGPDRAIEIRSGLDFDSVAIPSDSGGGRGGFESLVFPHRERPSLGAGREKQQAQQHADPWLSVHPRSPSICCGRRHTCVSSRPDTLLLPTGYTKVL